MKNKTAHYQFKKLQFEIHVDELNESLDEHQVLAKVKWVGICGSDLSTLELDFLDDIVLGHEWVGEIISIGSKVTGFKPGDIVTSGNKIKCGHCENCLSQKGECQNLYLLTANHGMLREYAIFPMGGLIKLPESSNKNSTLFEIIAVAENVWMRSQEIIKESQGKILIMGSGLLGLSIGLVLQREGVSFEIIDIDPARVKRAKALNFSARSLNKAVLDDNFKDHFQVVIDATGDHLGSPGGWKFLDHFGAAEFHGIILAKYVHDVPLKTFRLFSKQANLSWIQGCTNESLIKAIASFKDRIDDLGEVLITHTFKLDEVSEAFEVAKDRTISGRVIVEV